MSFGPRTSWQEHGFTGVTRYQLSVSPTCILRRSPRPEVAYSPSLIFFFIYFSAFLRPYILVPLFFFVPFFFFFLVYFIPIFFLFCFLVLARRPFFSFVLANAGRRV